MRVLQLAKFYPPERGGIESIVHELTEGLNAAGCPTDVLCAHRQWRSVDERAPAGYRVIRAGSLGSLLSTSVSPALVARLWRIAPAYDIIHVHMPNPLAAVALWLVRPSARVVLHWHSDVVHQRRALRLYQPLQRWLLARADSIVATSQRYADASTALAPWRSKLTVLPLGIGDNARSSDEQSVQALRSAFAGRKLVFALGRLVDYKGFDVLIDAAGLLPSDAVVLIGGNGPIFDRLQARVRSLGLQDRVRLIGPIDDSELMTYHRAADVFCLPSISRAEAFGVAMLEAMSAGKPVVCTDVAGSGLAWVNRDGETGLLAPPGDHVSLAGSLRQVLSDANLARRLGGGARARFEQHFQATAMVSGFEQLYRRLGGK